MPGRPWMKAATALVAALLALAPADRAAAQAIGGNASLSVTSSSARVQLPANTQNYPSLMIVPAPSSTGEAFYLLGDVTATALTTSPALPPGGVCVNIGPSTYLAAITATGTATLRLTQLNTCAGFSGAGASTGGGILPPNAATATNQTNVQTTVAPGTAPPDANVSGCVYNLSPPAPTNGQTFAQQCDSAGNQNVDVKGPVGQATVANSIPVTLPSNPDQRPGSGNITIVDSGSSSTTGQNGGTIVTGTPTANSFYTQAINGQSSVRVQVSGTWTGTLSFESSVDGGMTWASIPLRVTGTVYTQASVTGNGDFYGDVSGLTNFRVRATAAVTGTAVVQNTYSAVSGAVQILNPVRVVDNGSGATATIKPASTAPASTDTSVVVAQNPNAPMPAGQNSLGNVGALTKVVCVTPTVTNATYAANVVVGGLLTFSNIFTSTHSGTIQAVSLDFTTAQTVGFLFFPFATSPTNASTWTDHSAAAISGSTDIFATRMPTSLANPNSALGTMTNYGAVGIGQPIVSTDANLYGILVPTATTASLGGTTNVIQICVKVLQDS